MTPLDASRSPGDASEPGLVAAEVLAGRALAGPEAASDASTCAAETRIGLFDISSATRTGLSGFVNDRVHRACGVGRPGIARVSSDPGIDEPLAMTRAGSLSYFSVDGLGSVVATNDASGTVTHSVVFDAWGNVKAENGTRTHPFTYTGREVAEAGFHFYRARYYQPGIGRFLQEDPLRPEGPGGLMYAYVLNNPAGWTDPRGLATVKRNDDGSSTVIVGQCEVAFIHGHGRCSTPHTARFKGTCSAAGFIGCGADCTNTGIPEPNRIPGAPTWTGDVDNRGPEYEDAWQQMLEGAMRIAESLCECNCDEVTISFPYTKGGNFFEDTFTARAPKPIKIQCRPKPSPWWKFW